MDHQILAHTKYNCTYHIVFIPKYRRKVMYGKLGKEIGEILATVCKITGIQLIKGGVCPNHVHMYVSVDRHKVPAGVASGIASDSIQFHLR